MLFNKKLIALGLSVAFSSVTIAQEPEAINTKKLIAKTKKTVNALKRKVLDMKNGIATEDIAYLENQLATLSFDTQTIELALNKIKDVDVDVDGFFNVIPGSFKEQLMKLTTLLGIEENNVRFNNISECTDWDLDSYFQLDLSNIEAALGTFINDLPISYEYIERDNSLTINGLDTSKECKQEDDENINE